jgi:GNAT superfamily N-acetyltransferase
MQTLSSRSFDSQIVIDLGRLAPFRPCLLPQDPDAIETLVTRACVFNANEIAMARELAQEALMRGVEPGYLFLLADGADGLDGYTCYGPIPGTERRFELYWIAVEARARRRGLARGLLVATEKAARKLGATHLFAETSMRADYKPAHALYASLGYTLHGVVPDYHADADGLGIFGKKL